MPGFGQKGSDSSRAEEAPKTMQRLDVQIIQTWYIWLITHGRNVGHTQILLVQNDICACTIILHLVTQQLVFATCASPNKKVYLLQAWWGTGYHSSVLRSNTLIPSARSTWNIWSLSTNSWHILSSIFATVTSVYCFKAGYAKQASPWDVFKANNITTTLS